jgi:hypothetical protein
MELGYMAIKGNRNIIIMLLESVRAGRHKDTARRLLLGQDSKGRTAWYWAAVRGELDVLQNIWDLAKDILTTKEIKHKILLATDSEGNTAWHLAAENGKLDVLQKIWYLAKDILTTKDDLTI